MKTQIIQLEAHDDLISVRDKMGWGQAARVVLVWPIQRGFLARRLDLLLLQRHSKALGAQLALVTTDPDVRWYAHELQIPIFKTLRQAQSQKWRTRRRRPRLRPERRTQPPDLAVLRQQMHLEKTAWYQGEIARRGYYTLTLLVVLALVSGLLPGAKITLQPLVQEQELTLMVSAAPQFTSPSRTGQVPALPVSVVVEGRGTLPTTGQVLVPEKSAAGGVRFTNLTDQAVTIPEGTIVASLKRGNEDPVRFLTNRPTEVPARAGGFVSVPVIALNPGVSGNLPAGALAAIEGGLGLRVSAANLMPTSGGSSRTISGPAERDYQELHTQLANRLRQTALLEALSGLPEGSLAISETLVLEKIIEEIYEPAIPAEGATPLPAEELQLTLRLAFEVWTVSQDDIKTAALAALDASLPEHYRSSTRSIEVAQISAPEEGGSGSYSWRVKTSRLVYAAIDPELAVSLARSRTLKSGAELLYRALPLESVPTIEITPTWWPILPVLPGRIQLTVSTP